ncbi:hypothetical protein IWW52_004202 [Coemansia sp. RSA 2704]|nr:hypothetical protein IWW52_004202 [Coemansia sp. RSA 2704]
MPLFGKRKAKLQVLIKPRCRAKETFQHIVQSVVVRTTKEPTLRSRLMPVGKSSSIRRSSGSDPEIRRSIAFLTVLHGVVWSFPYTMNVLFTDQETCSLLLKFILSTVLPLTVRETMLCMVSNWCVLYAKSLRARLNLEGIVDAAKEKINLRPVARLLPAPPVTWEQQGWQYPALDPPDHSAPRAVQAHGSMPQLPGSRPPAPAAASATFNANSITDPVFLSQQRQLIDSFNSNHPRARSHSFRSDHDKITPEFTDHMLKSAQELSSLCDMLTDTLISLNVDEDPRANSVCTDMLADIKNRKDALANFVGMLGQDHIDTLTRLTQTNDCVDRCMWLYDRTINAHNEWKAIQESLALSSVRDPHPPQLQHPQAGDDAFSSVATRPLPSSSSSVSAVASTSKVFSCESLSVRNHSHSNAFAGSRGPSTAGMSSKARGKMPDLSMPDDEGAFRGPDSAYGGSGERSG